MVDILQTWIALLPLAAYLVLLGAINLRQRPTMISGAVEKATLAAALAGFVFIGPVQLFMPEEAATALGPWVWLPLSTLFVLCVAFWILSGRERLVIYNVSRARLETLLAEIAPATGSALESAGDVRRLPALGVQFVIDEFRWMRCGSLVAVGLQQPTGWQRLARALQPRLRAERSTSNPRALSLISLALALCAIAWMKTPSDDGGLTRGLYDLLRLDDGRLDNGGLDDKK